MKSYTRYIKILINYELVSKRNYNNNSYDVSIPIIVG